MPHPRPDQARAYFATAMGLGDGYQRAWALRHAGIQMVDDGIHTGDVGDTP